MEKFSIRIHTDEFRFRYARGVHEHTGKEFHPYHEIFFLLNGEAEFVSEQGKNKLTPGTTMIVPRESFHQFINTGNETDYFRCTFSFGEIAEFSELINKKFRKIMFLNDNIISEIFVKAKDITSSTKSQLEKKILLKAYLAEILVHMDDRSESLPDADSLLSPITKNAIAYINQNIAEDLSLCSLSERLHVSASHLSRVFKTDMHLSIHKYIQQKRLILANEKILHSASAIQAAAECGYHDYSNFYMQYKKYFGVAPSQSDGHTL